MRKLVSWMISISVLSISLGCSHEKPNQTPPAIANTPEMYFSTEPAKQLFWLGEPVVIGLELYSRFEQPVLVAPLQNSEFVQFELIGPDGKKVQWQGKAPDRDRDYSPSDFKVLEQYNLVKAEKTISLKDGTGFAFNQPGQYMLTAVFSMGKPEHFSRFSGQAKPVVGSVHSSKLALCIEACILKPMPVQHDVPQSALDAVRVFYTNLTKHPLLGLPSGKAQRIVSPFLSTRLSKEIDGLETCDKDYYRRYEKILRANTYKPATPWLEVGLFTGPNDAAGPSAFRILGSRSVGKNRVDVLLAFKEDWGESQGDVTVILENNRWVIDDYVAMYENDELKRLSAGYAVCEDGRWVGEPAY
jgi:hypothetical protein